MSRIGNGIYNSNKVIYIFKNYFEEQNNLLCKSIFCIKWQLLFVQISGINQHERGTKFG